MSYRLFRHWNVTLGCDAVRISVQDAHGGEHWALVPQDAGRRVNRERREPALEQLYEHADRGYDLGQVLLD